MLITPRNLFVVTVFVKILSSCHSVRILKVHAFLIDRNVCVILPLKFALNLLILQICIHRCRNLITYSGKLQIQCQFNFELLVSYAFWNIM